VAATALSTFARNLAPFVGFSLTCSIAVGLSSVLGTMVPPLVRGQFAAIASKPGAEWVIGGVLVGAAGIASAALPCA
jgi:L-rhamnose-H+ transport protein